MAEDNQNFEETLRQRGMADTTGSDIRDENYLKKTTLAIKLGEADQDGDFAKYIEEKRLKDLKRFEEFQKLLEENSKNGIEPTQREQSQLEKYSLAQLDSDQYYMLNVANGDVASDFIKNNEEKYGHLVTEYDNELEAEKNEVRQMPEMEGKSEKEIGFIASINKFNQDYKVGLDAVRFIANPVGFVASKAIVAGVGKFFETDTGKAFVQGAKEKFEKVFPNKEFNAKLGATLSAVATVGGLVMLASGMDGNELSDLKSTITGALEGAIDNSAELASSLVENADQFADNFAQEAAEYTAGMGQSFDNLQEGLANAAKAGGETLSEAFDSASEMAGEAYDAASKVAGDVYDATSEVAGEAAEYAKEAGEEFGQSFDEYTDGMGESFENAKAGVKDAFDNGTDNFAKAVENAKDNFEDAFGGGEETVLAGEEIPDVSDYNPETDPEYMNPNQRAGFEDLSPEEKAEILAETDPSNDYNPETDPEYMNPNQRAGFEDLSPEEKAEILAETDPSNDYNPETDPEYMNPNQRAGFEDLSPEEKAEILAETAPEASDYNPETDPEYMNPNQRAGFEDLSPEEKAEILAETAPEKPEVEGVVAGEEAPEPIKNTETMARPDSAPDNTPEGANNPSGDTEGVMAGEEAPEATTEPELVYPSSVEIQSGDRLESIAKEILSKNDANVTYDEIREFTLQIAEHNGLEDADKIMVGQTFDIPSPAECANIELEPFKLDTLDELKGFDKVPYGSEITPEELSDQIKDTLTKTYPDEPERVHEAMANVNASLKGLESGKMIESGTDLSKIGDIHENYFGENRIQISDELESAYENVKVGNHLDDVDPRDLPEYIPQTSDELDSAYHGIDVKNPDPVAPTNPNIEDLPEMPATSDELESAYHGIDVENQDPTEPKVEDVIAGVEKPEVETPTAFEESTTFGEPEATVEEAPKFAESEPTVEESPKFAESEPTVEESPKFAESKPTVEESPKFAESKPTVEESPKFAESGPTVEEVKLDSMKTELRILNNYSDSPTVTGTVTLNGQEIDVKNLTPEMQDKLFVSGAEKAQLPGVGIERKLEEIEFSTNEREEFRELLGKDNNLSRLLNGENLNDASEPDLALNSQESQLEEELRKEMSNTNGEGTRNTNSNPNRLRNT